MIYPSADTIEERVHSRYSLVVIAAKRAKQIKEGAPVLIDTLSTNPLTIALEEIAAGKVTVSELEQETAPVPASPEKTPGSMQDAIDELPLAEPNTPPFITADAEEDQTGIIEEAAAGKA